MRLIDGTEYDDRQYEIIDHWFKHADKNKADKSFKSNWKFKKYIAWNRPDMLQLYLKGHSITDLEKDFKGHISYNAWLYYLTETYYKVYKHFTIMGITVDEIDY